MRVRRLQRLDRGDLPRAAELLDAEIGDADVPDKAVLLQLREGRPTILQLVVGDWPMNLIEVDGIDPSRGEAARNRL
jgi:hypothetical protein